MQGKPRRWTPEFRLQALKRMEETNNVSALAEELGLNRVLLYRWHRKYKNAGVTVQNSDNVSSQASVPSVTAPLSDDLKNARRKIKSLESTLNYQRTAHVRVEALQEIIAQQQQDLAFYRAVVKRYLQSGDTAEPLIGTAVRPVRIELANWLQG